jgi:hypothetical protein
MGVEDDKLRRKLYDAVINELDKLDKFKESLKELDQPQKNAQE